MTRAGFFLLAVGLGSFLIQGCQEAPTSSFMESDRPLDLQDVKMLDMAVCDPGTGDFSDPLGSDNPYFPLVPGYQWTLEGEEDDAEIVAVITVLNLTRTVAGIHTRVVEEWESEDGDIVEISWNYYAETDDGTVCYFGEDVDDYDEGPPPGEEPSGHGGAWCAEDAGSSPGIFMPADPQPGMMFQQELAPDIAEDQAKIVASGPVSVEAGEFFDTIRFREYNPLDEEKDYKTFAMDEGFIGGIVIDGPLELTDYTDAGVSPGPAISVQVCGS